MTMIRRSLLALLATALAACTSSQSAAPPPSIDEIVSLANKEVLARYAETRAKLLAQVGAVTIVNFSQLLLYRNGELVWSRAFQTPLYDEYKAIAHIPLGPYVVAATYLDGPPSDDLRTAARGLRERVKLLLDSLERTHIPATGWPRQRAILEPTIAILDKMVADGIVSRAELVSYARSMAPLQLANADDAAVDMLDRLHEATQEMRGKLRPGEWERLYVLAPGGKMPRVGNLQYEYFVRLLGEKEREHRVLYTEGLMTPDVVYRLLGTVVIDRSASQAFFDEPYRLDRDLLSDGAAKHLKQMFGPAR